MEDDEEEYDLSGHTEPSVDISGGIIVVSDSVVDGGTDQGSGSRGSGSWQKLTLDNGTWLVARDSWLVTRDS